MKAVIHVYLKTGVLDVQGKAVQTALHGMGWADVQDVRVGRVIEFALVGNDETEAKSRVEAMCARLLANPVIEGYRVEIAA